MVRYISLLLFIGLAWGQSNAGAIFLLISPSPTINGLGGSGVSLSTMDIYSSYYNPAQPRSPNGFSFQYSDMKTNWLSGLADDLTLEYDVKMIGYNGLFDTYLLQFSITQSNTYLDLGEQVRTSETGDELGTFTSYMLADATTVSVGLQSKKFPMYLGIGRTDKKAKQKLAEIGAGSAAGKGTSKDKFYDWGFRFSIDHYTPRKFQNIGLSYSFGYSKSNIGDFIYFIDPDQADPAPTTARLGMTFGGKFTIFNDLGIDFRVIREVEELMIETIEDTSLLTGYDIGYKEGLFGDINLGKHIFNGQPDEDVVIHKGTEINFFNFYSIRKGIYIDVTGKIDVKTSGYGINLGEMIKFVSYLLDNSSLREIKLFKYINLKYNFSRYDTEIGHPLYNTKFDEFTLSINIDRIFSGKK